MKICLIILLTCLYTVKVSAQEKTIRGFVLDAHHTGIPGATISLQRSGDSMRNEVKLTNVKGSFEFTPLQKGTFILSVTSTGFLRFVSSPVIVRDEDSLITVPVISLVPSNVNLQELVVKARRPLLVQDIDKTIVNVDAMISSATSNILEVLDKTPGVTVGNDGDISLNGKNGVLVLIDGKTTYMSGGDLATYLKSLPGGLVDKIELMDNPPAKYDAAGSAIINIRLKKNKLQGITGNVSTGYSQGVYGTNNNVVNINYNRQKISLFSNIGYYAEKKYTNDSYDRKFYNNAGMPLSAVLLSNSQVSSNHGTNLRLGMDYSVSSKTNIGAVMQLNANKANGSTNYTGDSYGTGSQPDSINKGTTTTDNRRKDIAFSLNFLHKFNDAGNELTADASYFNYRFRGNQYLDNFGYTYDNMLQSNNEFRYHLPADFKIYTIKADYAHPLKNNKSWETGIKSSIVNNDNDSRYFITNGSIEVPDYSKSNHFIYRENINAAYLTGRANWKRFGFQLGGRLENTHITGMQLGNNITGETSFSKNYTGLFPTAFVSYKIDSAGSNTLTTSFAKRINRPNYQLLNPFLLIRDSYSYIAGNPLLNPQYQYRLELKYQHKQYLGIALQYGRFTNIIFQTTEAVNNIFITRPNNVSSGYQLIVSVNLTLNPAKWWSINTNLMAARMQLNGRVYTEKLNPGNHTVRINLINQFNVGKGWNAELTAFYAGKDIQGQPIVDPRYRVAAAAQKKIFDSRGSIRISAEDIFHSWLQKDNTVSIKQAASFHTSESDTQRWGVAFTWRFGKETATRKRKRADNGDESEKTRID